MRSLAAVLVVAAAVSAKPQIDFGKLGETLTGAAENLGAGVVDAVGDVGEELAKAGDDIAAVVQQNVQNIPTPQLPPGFPLPGTPGFPSIPGLPNFFGGAGGAPPGAPPGAQLGLPFDPSTMRAHMDKLNTICDGAAPKQCSCFYREDDPIKPKFNDPLELFDCTPDECECEDGTKVKADRPMPPFARPAIQLYKLQTKNTCGGEIQNCKCNYGDKETIDYPWKDENEFLNCNPTECNCINGSTEKITETAPPQFILDMLEQRNRKLKFMCEGEWPTECTCANLATKGTWNPSEEGKFIRQLFCNPATCTCPSGDTFKYPRPERPQLPQAIKREMAEVMCGGTDKKLNPIECKCADESSIIQPFSEGKIMKCMPKECKCLGDGQDESEAVTVDIRESAVSNASPLGKLNRMCEGEAPLECTCLRKDESISSPFTVDNLFSTILGCGPDKCTCADGTIRKTQIPIRPLLDLKDLCDGDLPESCICDDGESTVSNLDITKIPSIMKDCKPRTCKCAGSEENKPLQTFGCVNGGAPDCKALEGGERGKLICDGKVLTVSKLAAAKISGECVCENGIKPVCSNTEQPPKCPDGEDPDPIIAGAPQNHLKKCRDPEQ